MVHISVVKKCLSKTSTKEIVLKFYTILSHASDLTTTNYFGHELEKGTVCVTTEGLKSEEVFCRPVVFLFQR